jgi:5-methylcytosine-specific restriction enzyme subunit McrC
MPQLVVHEGGRIVLPPLPDPGYVIDQLISYSDRSSFPCFRRKKGALFAAEVVGTVQVGALRISILPISAEGTEEHDKAFLLNLLRAAGYLGRQPLVRMASVRSSAMDPLEAMLVEVGAEIQESLRDGVPRRYNEVEDEAQTIRGRIDFTRLCRQLPGASAALPIRYAPLTIANSLARTVRWVAESLLSMARWPETRQLLQEVLRKLDAVAGPRPTRAEIVEIRLTRLEQRWSRTVMVAALLAEGRFIDPTFVGSSDAFGILFPLHHLFERAMRRVLTRAAKPLGLTVEHKSSALYMLRDSQGTGHLQVRPDFLFCHGGQRLIVGDAKWKRLSKERRASGVDRDDVFQMNAYLTRYQLERSAIFIPRAPWMPEGWRHDFTIPPGLCRLSLVPVEIQRVLSRVPSTADAALRSLESSIGELAGLTATTGPAKALNLPNSAGPQLP